MCIPYSITACLEVQTHVCLAKPVNRLHRVPDAEQCPAVILLPTGNQFLEECHLAARGILKFVHKDVLKPIVHGKCQVAWLVDLAHRHVGRQAHSDIICLAEAGEGRFEFRHRIGQQGNQCPEDSPLLIAIDRVRQPAKFRDRFKQGIILSHAIQQGRHFFFFDLAGRGEATILVKAFSPAVCSCQQELRQTPPDGQRIRIGKWNSGQLVTGKNRRNRLLLSQCGGCICGQPGQPGVKRRRCMCGDLCQA